MRLVLLAAIATCLAAGPASASAGFWCDADDASIGFIIEGGLSRSIPGPPFNTDGSLAVKLPDAPDDFREIEITPDDLAQSWFDGDDVRLEIYRERSADPFASISFIVKTSAVGEPDEGHFEGTYALSIFASTEDGADPLELKASGPVSCGMG